ncbi:MAG: hypothetical protein V1782_05285, partial [Pseudomonadota bacterium]
MRNGAFRKMKKVNHLLLVCALLLICAAGFSPVQAEESGKWVLVDTVVQDNTADVNKEYQASNTPNCYVRYADCKVTMNQVGYLYDRDRTEFNCLSEITWEAPPAEFSSEKIRELKLTVTGNITGMSQGQIYDQNLRVPGVSITLDHYSSDLKNSYFADGSGMGFEMEDTSGRAITSLTRELFIDEDNLRANPGDPLWIIVSSNYVIVTYIYEFNGEGGFQSITTSADEGTGETPFTVSTAIVIGLAGLGVALAGAAGAASTSGGSSGSSSGTEDEKAGSTYKMIVYKDFGNKIRYDKPAVFVYARMAEIKRDGTEVNRPDLTQRIQIASETTGLTVGSATLAGDYMGAGVAAESAGSGKQDLREGVIRFQFTGQGGVFQNHMTFNLTGEPLVALDGEKLYVLGTSRRSFELGYELVDFMKEPKVRINVMQEGPPFTLDLGTTKEGKKVINATDCDESKTFEIFFNSFACEIIAENENETARTVFYVVLCYEGILPNFLGKPREIRAYRVSLESEEMSETLFDVQLGQWSEDEKTLVFVAPEQIDVTLTDDEGVFERIGMDITRDEEFVRSDAIRYIAKAETNLPAENNIPGTMELSAVLGDKTFENAVDIQLIPDTELFKAQYKANFEKEYAVCKKVIEIYIPSPFKERKLAELERARSTLGIADLRIFRRKTWSYAQTCVMQEKASYLQEEAWYDEAIATAELIVYIGDIAFGLAMAPIGGPIAGFVADQ